MTNKYRPISPEQLARLAHLGRGGDTMLAHINPEEAELLKLLGGSGTINPHTGLPEFAINLGLQWNMADSGFGGGDDWYDAGDFGGYDTGGSYDTGGYYGGGGAADLGTNPDTGAVKMDFTGMAPGVSDTAAPGSLDFGPGAVYVADPTPTAVVDNPWDRIAIDLPDIPYDSYDPVTPDIPYDSYDPVTPDIPYDPGIPSGPPDTTPPDVTPGPPIDQIPDLGEIVIPDKRPPETPYVYPPEDLIPPGDILIPVIPEPPPIDQIPDLGEIVIPDKRPPKPPPEPPPEIPLIPPGDILIPVPPVEPEIPTIDIIDKRPPKPPVIDLPPEPPVIIEPPDILEPVPPVEPPEPPPEPPLPPVEPPEPPPEPPLPPVEPPPPPPEPPPLPPIVEPPPPPEPPIVEPPPPPPVPPVEPPVVPPVPPVVVDPATGGRMINPGWIQAQAFYNTTNPAQSKFFWGGHGPQFESGNPAQPFDARAYNQVAAPGTPWGAQQVAAPLSPADYQAIIAGTYRAPAPATAATRVEAYRAPTQTAPSYGQVRVGGPVAPTATTAATPTKELYTADQRTAITQALGSDWQKRLDNAALNGDYATIVAIQNQINSVLNPVYEQP